MEKKDRKNNGSPSGTFKIGAIALAFLIIGYQSALFVNRAAVLCIEANRDRPDTVYVYVDRSAPRGDAPPRDDGTQRGNTSEDGTSSKGSSRRCAPQDDEARRGNSQTIMKEAPHSEAVKQVRARTRKVESFRFDPNTVSVEDLQRLGFSEKQAAAIDGYRAKGGRFRRPADFAKSYVVADSIYRRLEPYIHIPKVNINTADSAALDALPGIGPYLAAKIIAYRQEFGGFTSTEQLMDIKYFDRERYDALSDLICCEQPF